VAVDSLSWPAFDVSAPRTVLRSWERRLVTAVVCSDLCAAAVGGLVAFALRWGGEPASPYRWGHVITSLLLPLVWWSAMAASRAYEIRFLGIGYEEFRRVLVAAVAVIACTGTFAWMTKADIARGYVIIALPLATLATLGGRYLLRKVLHQQRRRGRCGSDVVVVGHVTSAAELIRLVRKENQHGMRIVGACVPAAARHDELHALGVPVVGTFDDVEHAVEQVGADTVAVLSCPEIDGPGLRRLSWSFARSAIDLLVAPALIDVAGPRIAIRPVCGLPLLHVDEPELTGGRRVAKGCLDRLGAATALLVLALPLAAVALLVRATSPGPALFRQQRIGRRGATFTMLKFRTMWTDAEARRADLVHLNVHGDGPMFKILDDPRVTPLGRWLRRTSLDELPQLLNVLRGEMSLVGPRPPLPEEVQQYEPDVRRRLLVKPGLTGLWQISGRADLDWEESVRLDLRYVENWSLALDAVIVWKTLFALARRDGAY
jgi:exopolysaccharide biosynthesis polyprenyl glycosylphosphotransferase